MPDPRCFLEAWTPGKLFLVKRNDWWQASAPAIWNGSTDPLKFDPAKNMINGLDYLPHESYILCLGNDIKKWMNSDTFFGVNCVYKEKIVWFIVDTHPDKQNGKKFFGFDLLEVSSTD